MLILILINVQYLQIINFSFEKGLNGQNHSLSHFHHLIKKIPLVTFPPPTRLPSLLLNAVWKILVYCTSLSNSLHLFCQCCNIIQSAVLSSV